MRFVEAAVATFEPCLPSILKRDVDAHPALNSRLQESDGEGTEMGSSDEVFDDVAAQHMDEMVRTVIFYFVLCHPSHAQTVPSHPRLSPFVQAFLRPWGADGSAPQHVSWQDESDPYGLEGGDLPPYLGVQVTLTSPHQEEAHGRPSLSTILVPPRRPMESRMVQSAHLKARAVAGLEAARAKNDHAWQDRRLRASMAMATACTAAMRCTALQINSQTDLRCALQRSAARCPFP